MRTQHLTILHCLTLALLWAIIPSAQASASDYKTDYRYNIGGQLTGVIHPDPDGSGSLKYLAERHSYNTRGLLQTIEYGELASWPSQGTAPENWSGFTRHRSVWYEYDSYGRQTAVINRDANDNNVTISQVKYNNLNQVECEMVRMSTTLASDACVPTHHGNDVWDRVTRYTYNNNDDIKKIEKAVGTPLAQTYAQYTYHYNGALETTLSASVTDANNNQSRYEYDNFGRLEYWYFPTKTKGAGTDNSLDYEKYGYDNNGNRTSLRKRDGNVINYTYDALNRVTKKDIPGTTTQDVYYTYNNLGLQTKAVFGSTTGQGVTQSYSGFGELKTQSINMGGTTRAITHLYDKHSNRIRVTHPDYQYFTYDHDKLDRATYVKESGSTIVLNHTYRSTGTPWQILRNNNTGNVTEFDHDNINRLTDLNWKQGSAYYNQRDFSYNRASQVENVTTSNHNLLYKGNNNIEGTWVSNGLNQYSSVNGQTYTYDANGNLRSDGTTTYTYDVENRLTNATGAKNITLTYDPLGRLHTTTASGVTTTYLYDGDALIAEYQGSTLKKRYVHGNGIDNPMVQYENGSVNSSNRRYLHADHQGSIMAITNASGSILNLNTYDAFGIPATSNQGRFAYTGQIYLPELGMYHYKARVYEPKLGRFLQTDPIGYDDQMNLYAYVGNDPMNLVDPSGMEMECNEDGTQCTSTQNRDDILGIERKAAQEFVDNAQKPNSSGRGGKKPNSCGTIKNEVSIPSSSNANSDFDNCVSSCINQTYGLSYDLAGGLNPLSAIGLAGLQITNGLEDSIRSQGNRNTYKGHHGFIKGARQLRTLAQFRRFNQATLVMGAGAAGYQLGAIGVCREKCEKSGN